MTRLFSNGFFLFPPEVSDISRVPEESRADYIYDRKRRRYRLKPELDQLLGPLRRELEELEAASAAQHAGLERRLAAVTAATIADGVQAALVAAGVPKALVRGAAAILQETHDLTLKEAGDAQFVTAQTRYGEFGVDALVAQFLDSDDGEGYRGKPKQQPPGYFGEMLR